MTTARKLTTGQVADRMGVDERTVRRWADEGRIDYIRTIGGRRRFDPDHITQKIQENR